MGVGGRFYGHYFLQILPPLCLLSSYALVTSSLLKRPRLLMTLLLIPTFFFWGLRLDQRTVYQYFPDDQLFLQQDVGEWIEQNTQSDETLFIWGFATAIYFHSQRKPVSRFLWADLLTGKVGGPPDEMMNGAQSENLARPEAWEALMQDLEKNPPDYIIDTAPVGIHGYDKYPLQDYPILWLWMQKKYSLWNTVHGVPLYKRN